MKCSPFVLFCSSEPLLWFIQKEKRAEAQKLTWLPWMAHWVTCLKYHWRFYWDIKNKDLYYKTNDHTYLMSTPHQVLWKPFWSSQPPFTYQVSLYPFFLWGNKFSISKYVVLKNLITNKQRVRIQILEPVSLEIQALPTVIPGRIKHRAAFFFFF